MANPRDEIRSIKRFISQNLNWTGNAQDRPLIYEGRPLETWKRPAIRIDTPSSNTVPGTRQYFFDERTFVIQWFAASRSQAEIDAMKWVDKLRRHPTEPMRIPLWLFNYVMAPPILRAKTVTPATALLAGTYSVQLVAENDYGHLTFASPTAAITITAGQAIDVQVPIEPRGYPMGYRYHIYLSGANVSPTAAHRVSQAVVVPHGYDPIVTLSADVPNGAAGATPGNAPALLSGLTFGVTGGESQFRFKYMTVDEDGVNAGDIIEDPDEDGKFNNIIRLRTKTINVREYSHEQPINVVTVSSRTIVI